MYIDLVRSIFSRPRGQDEHRKRSTAIPAVTLVALALLVGTLYAGTPLDAARQAGQAADGVDRNLPEQVLADELTDMEGRVERVQEAWSRVDSYYRSDVAPIRRVLLRYRDDAELAEKVAVALVREANKVGLEPRLLLAVLLVENPWLEPKIRSPVGAVGLMQVMPLHRGAWPACEPDLEDIDANICHGARIFAHYFRRSNGNIERALLRYNGCVNGTNTPNCHQYPYHVFARAGKASVLAWLETGPTAASR